MKHRSARACAHCGSPARGNPCFERIDRADFYRRSGADAPCECDEARDCAERRARRKERAALAWLGIVLAIGAAWIWFFNH